MAIIGEFSALLSANGTSNGFATFTSTVGFYPTARAWLSGTGLPSKEVILTSVTSTLIGIKFIEQYPGSNYSNSDISAYTTAAGARLSQPSQLLYNLFSQDFGPGPNDFITSDGQNILIGSGLRIGGDLIVGGTITPSGTITLAAVGSSPNANAATLSVGVLNLEPASATQPGVVTSGAQVFGGAKTLSAILSSTVASGSDAIKLLDGARLNFSTADASAYFYRSMVDTIRTPGAFTADGVLSGSNLSGTNTGDITLTAVGSSPNSDGASVSGQALTLQPADASNPGIISTIAQTIPGAKTFSSAVTCDSGFKSTSGYGNTDAGNVQGLSWSGSAVVIRGGVIYLQTTGGGATLGQLDSAGLTLSGQDTGRVTLAYTNNSGTPGNTTISKASGRAAIAAGASVITVTNTLVTASSIVQVQIESSDLTAGTLVVVPGAGSFTVTNLVGGVAMNVTAATVFSFHIFN